jgi:hypothetical protein
MDHRMNDVHKRSVQPATSSELWNYKSLQPQAIWLIFIISEMSNFSAELSVSYNHYKNGKRTNENKMLIRNHSWKGPIGKYQKTQMDNIKTGQQCRYLVKWCQYRDQVRAMDTCGIQETSWKDRKHRSEIPAVQS